MSYRDLAPFTFTFEPMLKTREKVRVIVQIHTTGRGTYFNVSLFVPFLTLDGVIAQVKETLQAEAQGATHRWALLYSTIEEAHLGHEALTRELGEIPSPDFTVSHVIVQEIVPITPKVASPVPPPPPPPKKTRGERIKEQMAETIKDLRAFTGFEKECLSANADLFEDEDVGTQLKNRFGALKGSIVDPEEYR